MRAFFIQLSLSLCILSLPFSTVWGNSIVRDVREAGEGVERDYIIIPYAFYVESLDLTIGIGAGATGYIQDQMSLYGALQASSNSSFGAFFLGQNIKMPYSERLYLDTNMSLGWYTEYREYIIGNTDFPDEQAGSNLSSEDNFLTGEGWNNWAIFKFKYLLPIGQGRDRAIHTYTLRRGILVDGSTYRGEWNPLKSGRTYLILKPFAHWQSFDSSSRVFEDYRTNGLALGLKYDNTDFFANPSKGSSQRIEVKRDFGLFKSFSAWTAVEGEATKYLSLGETAYSRQRVFALNFWTAYSPTWEEKGEGNNTVITNRPPDYYGARLGGYYRMRGFPAKRFHDRAAIYYSAEYRVMPQWQPLREVDLLKPFEVDWWQFAIILEAGRVAEEWTMTQLHEEMKFDAGLSLRMMAFKSVGRLDVVVSEESFGVTALVGHPY